MIQEFCEKHKKYESELWPKIWVCEDCLVESADANYTITGQCPSGKNAITITRSGVRFPNKRFVKWREDGLSQLRETFKDITKGYTQPVNICVRYWAGDKRRRDVPGIIDALWHLVEKAGIINDDTNLGGRGCTTIFQNMGVLKGEARVEILIKQGASNDDTVRAISNGRRKTRARTKRGGKTLVLGDSAINDRSVLQRCA